MPEARISTDTAETQTERRSRRLSFGRNRWGNSHAHPRRHFGRPKFSGFKEHFMAGLGELIGTTMFLFLAEGGAKTAQLSVSAAQADTATPLSNETIMFIACSFGLSLLVTAWMFYRITGGLFNPAITLALWLVGVLTSRRAVILAFSQILGGICAAALVLGLTPTNSVNSVTTTLQPGINIPQGVLIEMLLTSILVFSVLMLAVEKHRATFLAPIGIGLTLFSCHLFGVVWTGCGMNPARSFGPAVVAGQFSSDHWIYWVGPLCGAVLCVIYFEFLKVLKYNSVVLDQDSDKEITGLKAIHTRLYDFVRHGKNPRAGNPESSTHYDEKARREFEKQNPDKMDRPVFEGHAGHVANDMHLEKPEEALSMSTASTARHSANGQGTILPK